MKTNLRSIVGSKNKSEYFRNVVTLMTGTTIAQLVTLAISPILTRLYTPEEFGLLALFVSIVSILSIVATGRYEVAIMLPSKEKDALNIMKLSIIILIMVCSIVLIGCILFNGHIAKLLNNKDIGLWLYFIPITVFFTGLFQNFNYLIIRKKEFKRLATAKILQSSTNAGLSLGFGFGGLTGGGLIIGNILGQFISATFLGAKLFKIYKNLLFIFEKKKILHIGKRYNDFLKFDVFAGFFSVATPQSIVILLGIWFSTSLVGIYALTNRVLAAPIYLISKSILDVFRQRATEDYNKFGRCDVVYLKTLKSLSLLAFFPFLILFLFGEDIFGFVFGEQWRQAGYFAKILSPMFFLKFISSPLSFLFYIAEKQKQNLIWQSILFVLTILSIYLGYKLENNNLLFICISVSYSIIYIIYLIISYNYSLGKK